MSERVLSKALTPDDETNYTESLFESIRHVNEYGQEFWYARELQAALEYKEWRNFCKVIEKAKTACDGSNTSISTLLHHIPSSAPVILMHSQQKEIRPSERLRGSRSCFYLKMMQ